MKATFRPQWVPQSQFAGYYVAKDKGFYKEAGIDLEIKSGGPAIHGLVDVAAKKETFCTDLLMSGMVLASKGAPIVNIAQTHQTTGLMLISYKSDNITKPEQLNGATVGLWPGLFEIPPSVFVKKFNAKYEAVQQGFTMDLFLQKKIKVASAMSYNEYLVVLESNVKESDLNVLKFQDFGLNFPDDGIYTHQDTCKNQPALCKNFVQASMKGWKWAFNNPEEATKIVMKFAEKAGTKTTFQHQLNMLKKTKEIILYSKGLKGLGSLESEDFEFVKKQLIETGKITEQNKDKLKYDVYYQPAL